MREMPLKRGGESRANKKKEGRAIALPPKPTQGEQVANHHPEGWWSAESHRRWVGVANPEGIHSERNAFASA